MEFAIAIAILTLGFVIVEGGLRLFFGFGNPLLYIPDQNIGYLLSPNQRLRRMGNRIAINQYSMRSPQITPTPAPETLRIMLVGDSVANGGWWTDREQTISQLMQQQWGDRRKTIEVLNASANSWGPRNELAYLQRFGLFGSRVLVLLLNTDDLFGTSPTSIPVGRDRNYPESKPPLALIEVYSRFLSRPQIIPELQALQNEGGDRVGINLNAIEEIAAIASQNNTNFVLALTPLLREIGQPGSRDYEEKARQRLLELTQSQNIPYLDFLPLFNRQENSKNLYRDHIHLSPEGNQYIARSLCEAIRNLPLPEKEKEEDIISEIPSN
ncbi:MULTISPECIES: SGNH/GDSL hydrolase family protein [Spirulina sp. CCY15215]|uniref:SGNH/GDSL hydrolase family protein n=1 Tax=Spirulina sp. CCY15215 TaxID=2767591 RepID=UPI0019520AF6|nr:SGNH/GDSL hydrolase family protein [Spirulina major]